MHICFIDDQFSEISPLAEFLTTKEVPWTHYDWSDDGARILDERVDTNNVVVLLDLFFHGQLMAPDILCRLRSWRPEVPVIVFTQNDSAIAFEAHGWGAKGYYVKSCTDFNKLWTEIERTLKESQPEQNKLNQAIRDARSPDVTICHQGLLACEEIIKSVAPQPHLLALKGKREALTTLAKCGVNENVVPIHTVIDELWNTCQSLNEHDSGVERQNIRIWKLASYHSCRDVGELARVALSHLNFDDVIVRELIDGTLRHHHDASSATSALIAWFNDVASRDRLAEFLQMALAVHAIPEHAAVAKLVSDQFVASLSNDPEAANQLLQQQCNLGNEQRIVEVLASGDADGNRSAGFLFRILADRCAQADTPEPGVLMRTTILVDQLSKWNWATIGDARAQKMCANLAFHLHCAGCDSHRDRVLNGSTFYTLYSAEAGTIVIELLIDVNTKRLTDFLEIWITDCDKSNRRDVADALLSEVKKLDPKRLWGDGSVDVLLNLARLLRNRGANQEATTFLLHAVNCAVNELPLLSSKKREEDIQKLRLALKLAKETAADGEVEPLIQQLERVHAELMQNKGPLDGRVVVIVGGHENRLPKYKEVVEARLGATCYTTGIDKNQVESSCARIRNGNVHTVVVVTGWNRHDIFEKVQHTVKQKHQEGCELPYWIVLPTAQHGADSIVRAILHRLAED